MKVLCLGNNTEDTEHRTKVLAGHQYNGLLSSAHQEVDDGYYQTSVFDLSRADIIDVARKFDKIVVLDQPKEKYSHPDSFYITVSVAQELSKKMPVEFLNQSDSDDIVFFENLVETNPSFCIFPFILLSNDNEYTGLCCRATQPLTKLSGLDFYNDASYKEVRQKMLNGQLLPEYCSVCYKQESWGLRSHRQQETVEWANRLNLRNLDDLAKIKTPAYYEVKPSNLCNLQCRMCVPSNSSKIEKEYKEIGLIPLDYTVNKYPGFDFVDFTNLKKFYASGGEPTLLPEFSKFLDQCIEENRTDIELLINTNATRFTDKFKNQINNFTLAGFIVSVDGIGEVGKYIRWPAEWEDVINNVQWILDSDHLLTFKVTVSIYNIAYLFDTLNFLESNYPSALIDCDTVNSVDDILSATNFPDYELVIAELKKIKKLKCYKNTKQLTAFIDGLVAYFQQSKYNRNKLIKFFEFNDKLDRSRDIKLGDYIPKLEKYRNEI